MRRPDPVPVPVATSRPIAAVRLRALLAVLLGVLLTGALVVGAAVPAEAHAALLSTTPANGEIVPTAPAEVTLTYGEAVGTGLGAIRVLASNGDRADTGQATVSDGDRVVHVPLRSGLADGSYIVVWRVVSADSHPVSGTFTFSVGAPTKLTGYAGRIAPPRSPSLLLGLTRGVGFAGLLVLLGGAAFCLLLWPRGIRARWMLLLLAGAAGVELLAAAAALLLQGPYAAGLAVSEMFNHDLLSEVLDTQF